MRNHAITAFHQKLFSAKAARHCVWPRVWCACIGSLAVETFRLCFIERIVCTHEYPWMAARCGARHIHCTFIAGDGRWPMVWMTTNTFMFLLIHCVHPGSLPVPTSLDFRYALFVLQKMEIKINSTLSCRMHSLLWATSMAITRHKNNGTRSHRKWHEFYVWATSSSVCKFVHSIFSLFFALLAND